MNTLTSAIVILVAAWVGYSAYAVLTHQPWVVDNLAEYGVPRSWWPWLGAAKTLGAAGLVAGVWLPVVGLAASAGLTVYFVGAVLTVLRAQVYRHVAYPLLFLAPVMLAGTLTADHAGGIG